MIERILNLRRFRNTFTINNELGKSIENKEKLYEIEVNRILTTIHNDLYKVYKDAKDNGLWNDITIEGDKIIARICENNNINNGYKMVTHTWSIYECCVTSVCNKRYKNEIFKTSKN